MRTTFLASAILLLAPFASPTAASAQDPGCRGSGFSCEDLRYYCAMGNQAPYSVRRYCGGYFEPRFGHPPPASEEQADRRYDRGYDQAVPDDDDGDAPVSAPPPRYSYRELQYYCAMGDQTPRTLQPLCFRFGLW